MCKKAISVSIAGAALFSAFVLTVEILTNMLLIDASFSSFRQRPPSGKTSTWDRGFDDGQRLVFHTRVARDLYACFVPVPPTPGP